ncbi:sugar ABC transporter permease [Sinomonas sp. G460-2]|uniref:sugar ABC transporter permease n=1 Tax=Sinomonas sp. G460-2 TaxID=3393464 RepID=UPI0039EEC768
MSTSITPTAETTEIPIPPTSRPRAWASVRRILLSRAGVLLIATLALVLYFQFASDGSFISPTNASLLLRQTAVVAVLAAGVAVLIIVGEIDLSIGSAAFLAGLVAAQCQVAGLGTVVSILAAVGAGLIMGIVQAMATVSLAIPAFIVTLAGFLVWRGIGLLWTNAGAVGPVSSDFIALSEGKMPLAIDAALVLVLVLAAALRCFRAFQNAKTSASRTPVRVYAQIVALPLVGAAGLIWVSSGRSGVPYATLWIAVVALTLGTMLTKGKFGRQIFLLGSNREAAIYAGINAKRTVIITFLIMGLIYGIGGVLLTARAGTSTADAGTTLELVAISAAVVGGNSLRGGVGSVWGAVMGAFLLSTIDNGMALLGVSSYAQNVAKGLILVIAVGLDGYFVRRRQGRS